MKRLIRFGQRNLQLARFTRRLKRHPTNLEEEQRRQEPSREPFATDLYLSCGWDPEKGQPLEDMAKHGPQEGISKVKGRIWASEVHPASPRCAGLAAVSTVAPHNEAAEAGQRDNRRAAKLRRCHRLTSNTQSRLHLPRF